MPLLSPALCDSLVAAVRAEREAAMAVSAARTGLRDAMRKTTEAARMLRAAGAPLTAVAIVVARALEVAPTVIERRRIAARFRRRFARERTEGHAKPRGPSPAAESSPLPSSHSTEDEMAAKLIKKTTVTEEFVDGGAPAPRRSRAEDTRDEALEEAMNDLGDVDGYDDDEDDDEPPRRRRKK